MKRKGCSIIFINDKEEVLLFLRDDIPDIPYPNTWDVPGGHVEPDETPEQCIIREMKEEIEIDLVQFRLFKVREFEDRIEYAFWKKTNMDIKTLSLHEGQEMRWFSEEAIMRMNLAHGFNRLLKEFYEFYRTSALSG